MAEDSSSFKRTVVLRDWWLITCSKEFEGKRFGVAGTQIAERGAMRVFTSSPIITAFDVFTLQASDGVCIILRGFLNKQRLALSGFLPEISREFIFGFPPCWEAKCNSCFVGVPSESAINSVIDKASSRTVLSPCKWNLEDSPALVVEEKISDKDGHGDGSIARDEIPARKKSLRLQSKSAVASKVKTSHGSEGSSKGAKSCGVEKDDCEGNERKLDESRDHVSEGGLDKDKSSDVEKWNLEDSPAVVVDKNTEEKISDIDGGGGSTARDDKPARKRSLRLQSKSVEACKDKNKTTNHDTDGLSKGAKSCVVEIDECVVINSKVISPADGCGKKHTGADNVDKRVTSMSSTGESLTSEQEKGELEAKKACPPSMFEDFEKSGKPGNKAVSKKIGRTLKSAGDVVEHSGTKDKTANNKRKLGVSEEVQDPATNDVVENVNHSGTKVKRKHDGSEVKDPTINSECLIKAEGNGVEKDECRDDEEIPRVDRCGKMNSGTSSKKITSTKATLTSERRKDKLKVTKTSLHSLSKEVSDSTKPGKNEKSKKSEKILKGDLDVVVEPMTPHSGSKVKDNLSVGKTIRKIDFDEEVTPEKDGKKQKTNSVSADSLGQKRSRSGRVLVSSLEYWRNQVPVYDADRNLIQVNEGHQTNSAPSKRKRIRFSKAKKMNIK